MFCIGVVLKSLPGKAVGIWLFIFHDLHVYVLMEPIKGLSSLEDSGIF